MRKCILIIATLFIGNIYGQSNETDKSQNKWFSTVELEFSIPNETRYDSSLLDSNGNYLQDFDTELSNKATYGLLYTINYPVLKRLNLGFIGGYSYHTQPEISNAKLGGIVRYNFIEDNLANFYLMSAYNFSLNENFKSDFGNIRLGLSFSILEKDNYNLILNGFWDYSTNETKKPLIHNNEGPGFIFLKSYGLSIGVHF